MQVLRVSDDFAISHVAQDRIEYLAGKFREFDAATLRARPYQEGRDYKISFDDAKRISNQWPAGISEDELEALRDYFRGQDDPQDGIFARKLDQAMRLMGEARDYGAELRTRAELPRRRLICS